MKSLGKPEKIPRTQKYWPLEGNRAVVWKPLQTLINHMKPYINLYNPIKNQAKTKET